MIHPPTQDLAPCQERPASACLVAQEDFRALRGDVTDIKIAICGNETMGHRGLIRRQEIAEADISMIRADVSTIRTDFAATKQRVLGIVSGAAFVGSGVGVIIGLVVQVFKK